MAYKNYNRSAEIDQNDTLITKNPLFLLQLKILEARFNLFDAIEAYNMRKEKGLDTFSSFIIVKARFKNLVQNIKPILRRHYNTNSSHAYEDFIQKIESQNPSVIFELIDQIEEILYKKNLTRIDREAYDTTRVSIEDNMKGLS